MDRIQGPGVIETRLASPTSKNDGGVIFWYKI